MKKPTLKSINHKFAIASVALLTAAALGGAVLYLPVNQGKAAAATAFWDGSSTANNALGSITINAISAAPQINGTQPATTGNGSPSNIGTTSGVTTVTGYTVSNGSIKAPANTVTPGTVLTITDGSLTVQVTAGSDGSFTYENSAIKSGDTVTVTTVANNDAGSVSGGQTNQGNTINDGSTQSVTNPAAMSNVTFSIQQIVPVTDSGDTSSTQSDTGYNLGTAAGMIAPTMASNGQVTNVGKGFQYSGTAQTVTTDSTSVATMDNLPNGYYLIEQQTEVNGVYEIQPFIVEIDTASTTSQNIQVYPKLSLSSSSLNYDTAVTNAVDSVTGLASNNTATVNTGDDNTAAANTFQTPTDSSLATVTGTNGNKYLTDIVTSNLNTADAGNTTTAAGGDTVMYNLNTAFDASQVTVTNAPSTTAPSNTAATTGFTASPAADGTSVSGNTTTGSYAVQDIIPAGLTPTANGALITVVNNLGTPLATQPSLTYGTDYTETISGTGPTTVVVTLTASGQAKVANALGVGVSGSVDIQIPVTVANGTAGTLTDTPTSTVTNAFADVITNATAMSATTVNVGGFQITKTDSLTGKAIIGETTGATFELVKSDSWADAQAFVEANAAYFDNKQPGTSVPAASNNTSLVMGNTSGQVNDTATTPVTNTSSLIDGTLTFTGINLAGTGNSSNTTQGTSNGGSTSGNYYAVEVVAPTGYQLPSPSTGSDVFGPNNSIVVSATAPTTNTDIANSKPFALPFTGGTGLAWIIGLAGALFGGFLIFGKRRREDDEEEVVE